MIDETTLRMFCAQPPDPREYLRAPWREPDGRVVATNGVVFIAIDALDGDYAPPIEKMVGRIDALLAIDGLGAPIALSTVALPEPVQCDECKGTGKGSDVCPSCIGVGAFDHHGHGYECKACDETGRVNDDGDECYACGGTGHARQYVEVGGSLFQARYLRMLADLPDCVIRANKDDRQAAAFAFDGGRGMLMPCRKYRGHAWDEMHDFLDSLAAEPQPYGPLVSADAMIAEERAADEARLHAEDARAAMQIRMRWLLHANGWITADERRGMMGEACLDADAMQAERKRRMG